MKFKSASRRAPAEYEKAIAEWWKENHTFEKSVAKNPAEKSYVFYDGPPFITGVPHHGTLLSSIVKDAVPRYFTMKGFRVERKWGWDCHGLPAENFVEKQLGIVDRRQILTDEIHRAEYDADDPKFAKITEKDYETSREKLAPRDKNGELLPTISLEKYIETARNSMVANSETWEPVIKRVGRWVDFRGAYRTMDKDFMESVWWAFQKLYAAGKIYEGEKVLMYDTRFATPVSKAEVTMDNDAYRTVSDPSVYVKFKLIRDEKFAENLPEIAKIFDLENSDFAKIDGDIFALAWTTTPWTLPGNTALAVNPEMTYCLVKFRDDESSGAENSPNAGEKAEKNSRNAGENSDGETRENYFIVAQDCLSRTLKNAKNQPIESYEILAKFGGEKLVGLSYEPLLAKPKNLKLDKKSRILFVCHSNAGRSHFAKGFYDKQSGTNNSETAGTREDSAYWDKNLSELEDILDEMRPDNIRSTAVMDEVGIDIRDYKRQKLTPEMLANYDLVVNLAEKSQTPDWLRGDNVIWWNVVDPHNETWEKARAARDEIERRVRELVDGKIVDDDIDRDANFAKIWSADYVSADSGTGIVHLAPIYGEEDFALAQKFGIPRRHILDDNGYYFAEISENLTELFAQTFGENYREILEKSDVKIDADGNYEVWSANKMLAKALKIAGVVWKIETVQHEYPFNPRSGQRIMYRAIPSWFFDVADEKNLLLEQNENINWFPAHLKHGRFAKNIEQAPDWNLSRDRFWATAMPVWKGDKGGIIVVGSYAELEKLSGQKLNDYHRPWVDAVRIFADKLSPEIREKYQMRDGEVFTRVDKVLDCWFESGSMPFAQLHYPFENRAKFEQNYPADFIVEYIGQVRAWFYYVHVVNTTLADIGAFGDLAKTRESAESVNNTQTDFAKNNSENSRKSDAESFAKNAFKNVITTGTLAGNDGYKMSKSRGNFTDPNELMDKFSADALRFLLLSSPVLSGEDFALQDKDVSDVARKLAMIWNMFDFFTMYAEVDDFEFPYAQSAAFAIRENRLKISLENLKNPLDIWVVSRLHETAAHVTTNMDAYNLPEALAAVLPFVDDASNWFVRRSRRRFWKSTSDDDKREAYQTLHYVLVELAILLAPFTPFLSEELFTKLTGGLMGESVHLLDWFSAENGDFAVDEKVLGEMARTRAIIANGLMLRMQKDERQDAVKIRQPLQFASYAGAKLGDDYEQIIREELNVKEVRHVADLAKYLRENDGDICATADGKAFAETDEKVLSGDAARAKILSDSENSWVEISKKISPELKREGLSREVIRAVQSARKAAGLNVDDRIILELATDDAELMRAIDEWRDAIMAETLATDMFDIRDRDGFATTAKIEGAELKIALIKAEN